MQIFDCFCEIPLELWNILAAYGKEVHRADTWKTLHYYAIAWLAVLDKPEQVLVSATKVQKALPFPFTVSFVWVWEVGAMNVLRLFSIPTRNF